jgi:hypothetical protein
MRKWRVSPQLARLNPFRSRQDFLMDAEHINLIGNLLADLSNRVNELRGYL